MIKYTTNIFIFYFLSIDFNPANWFLYSWEPIQPANQQSTGCQRGRRQGRSLHIRRARPKAGRWASSIGVRFNPLQGSPEKEAPPPSRLPLTPAPLHLSSSTAVSKTHPKNEPKIEGSTDAKWIPMEIPKSSKNCNNEPREGSREPLGTGSMKHPVSERSREGPMCFPCSK